MEGIISESIRISKEIINGEFKPLNKKNISKRQGDYIIKEIRPKYFEGKIFYVGEGKSLRKRIGQHLQKTDKQGSSSLRGHLKEKGLEYKEIAPYLENNCLFIIKEIPDSDMHFLIEQLLITVLRRRGEPLLNKENKIFTKPLNRKI